MAVEKGVCPLGCLFAVTNRVAAPDVARELGLSDRMVRVLLRRWVDEGWLSVADPSRRKRAYELTAIYRQYVGRLSAVPGPKKTAGKARKRSSRQ
jgi:hypothetical protein